MTILVRNEKETDILGSLKTLFIGSFKTVWIFLLIFVIIAANLIWLTERGSPAFDDKYSIGIWQSFWWAFVTITTVGYGDKVPLKPFSKVVAVFVMMAGIGVAGLAISQITAISQLKVSKYTITCKEDLNGKKVGTVAGSTSEKIINKFGGIIIGEKNVNEAVKKLKSNRVDAVVFDAPALQYEAKNNPNLVTVGKLFDIQDYGVLLPQNSKLKENIGQAVLLLMKNGKYRELEEKWFGI